MPVYKVKNYKIINGEKVIKTKEEFYKQTCGGKKLYFFKCHYQDLNGNSKIKRSKQFSTNKEASLEEAKFLLQVNNASFTDKTIYDLYQSYFFLDHNITNKDSSLYTKEQRIRCHVLPFFRNDKTGKYNNLTEINEDYIKKWKLWLNKKTLVVSTKKSIFNTFSSMMEYGKDTFNLTCNPLHIVGNFKEKNDKIIDEEKIRFITDDQYKLFIKEVDVDFKAVFHFLYESGCRKGELASLKWPNVYFKKKQIKLNTGFSRNRNGGLQITNTKNGKIKYLDISENLNNVLLEIYNKMSKLDGFTDDWYVFGGIRPISYTTLDRKKNEAFDRLEEKGINITRITIHEFRHSSASFMISNNIPIEVIAYRLGDTVETIRRVYAHLFPNTQTTAKNLFENL